MTRVRIRFSKTGRAVFTSHIDLPIIFARAARRAGLVPELTQGFTPRPRLALGPPLPVGAVGLAEPADFWFASWNDELFGAWRRSLPEGLEIRGARIEGEGVSLSKLCTATCCSIETGDPERARDALERYLVSEGVLLDIRLQGCEVVVSTREADRIGPAKFVSCLEGEGVISGWGDAAIARLAVGGWDEDSRSVIHLTEEC